MTAFRVGPLECERGDKTSGFVPAVNRVDGRLAVAADGFPPVGGLVNGVPLLLEGRPNEAPDLLFVVYQEDVGHLALSLTAVRDSKRSRTVGR